MRSEHVFFDASDFQVKNDSIDLFQIISSLLPNNHNKHIIQLEFNMARWSFAL